MRIAVGVIGLERRLSGNPIPIDVNLPQLPGLRYRRSSWDLSYNSPHPTLSQGSGRPEYPSPLGCRVGCGVDETVEVPGNYCCMSAGVRVVSAGAPPTVFAASYCGS